MLSSKLKAFVIAMIHMNARSWSITGQPVIDIGGDRGHDESGYNHLADELRARRDGAHVIGEPKDEHQGGSDDERRKRGLSEPGGDPEKKAVAIAAPPSSGTDR